MKIKLQLQPVYKTTPLTIPALLIEQIGCKRQLLQRNILTAKKWPFGSIGIANSQNFGLSKAVLRIAIFGLPKTLREVS